MELRAHIPHAVLGHHGGSWAGAGEGKLEASGLDSLGWGSRTGREHQRDVGELYVEEERQGWVFRKYLGLESRGCFQCLGSEGLGVLGAGLIRAALQNSNSLLSPWNLFSLHSQSTSVILVPPDPRGQTCPGSRPRYASVSAASAPVQRASHTDRAPNPVLPPSSSHLCRRWRICPVLRPHISLLVLPLLFSHLKHRCPFCLQNIPGI